MAPKEKKRGRKRGGSNKAGFYHLNNATRKGWYVSEGRRIVPLRDSEGKHVKDSKAIREAQEAYALYRQQLRDSTVMPGDDMRLTDLCKDYLASVKKAKTKTLRERFLFDFVTGFPPRFLKEGALEPTAKDRIHDGFGSRTPKTLTKIDVKRWVDAHPNWSAAGAERLAVQALKRVLNWAVKYEIITKNPIKGYPVSKGRERVTYFTPEQERELYQEAHPDFRVAIWVCIRTGARYGCEFAALEHRHIEESGKGMIWVFGADEAKTKSERRIIVPPDVADITRQQMKRFPSGRIFRNSDGTAWQQPNMTRLFSRLRERLVAKGVNLDADACLYTTRHTYAKRMLADGVSLDKLPGLMGNTLDVCWRHYARWDKAFQDPLFDAVNKSQAHVAAPF